ncbi:acetoacetate--CoA ligase [Ottowia sp. GY511]|uniref:Acetoacetate--CoA ligase n=1 Tax=Ottowia flava TaxID=2675430 RepID=A0ABW4KWE7_9BURK|nr:acetoacetate--CoA ligase [Ottowia sp. GY511]TXK27016.1 acetoacetate--CoA ligase [Ottowia sp. GY511]
MSQAPASSARIPEIRRFQDWLRDTRGLSFDDYHSLWAWSTTELDAFWQSIWDYFKMASPTPHAGVLARNAMPGGVWFPGAQVNYARQVMRHVAPADAAGVAAIISDNEKGQVRTLSWPELQRQVASLALHLRAQGVQPGDRVAAYLPNIPETMVAFLAVASLGAVWSVCAPDMGTSAVLDRFKQIEPKVLIACDGVTWAGRDIDRLSVLAELRAGLPTVQHVVLQRNLGTTETVADCADFSSAAARNDAETAAFEAAWLPFDHPLWVVYSSGTTGLPKPIVHGHGGMILVMQMLGVLHNDIGCSYDPMTLGERYHWYSSTGWVMWNAQLAGLLAGTTVVIYDGSPGGPKDAPDWTVLWRFAARHQVSFFGAGAAFYAGCMKAGVDLSTCGDLSRIRALGSTGSPLAPDVQTWGNEQFRRIAQSPEQQDMWWANISGGTDFCGAFIGGHRELPQRPGVMQCRQLGAAVEAWNDAGEPVVGQVGELVCVQPIPSMPLYLVGDTDGARYRASYFEMYPPGHGRKPGGGDLGPESGSVWRHGDWLKIGDDEGQGEWCVIYGRSDATINRHGLRMGTSEIYSAVEGIPEVLDSMVVDLEYLGRESYMPLFVVLRPGVTLDDALRQRLAGAIRTALSPRFVPDDVFQVSEIPRTLSGKKQELPIKKLLLGQPLDKVVNREAMANPASLAWYQEFAQAHLSRQPGA